MSIMKDNLLNWKLCKVKKNLIIANDFERWKPIFHVVLFTQTWEQLSLKTNKLSCFISFLFRKNVEQMKNNRKSL